MRYRWLYAGVLAASFLLSSCSLLSTPQQLEGGKHSFQQGNFRDSFYQLQPLAAKGNPKAQYAIGYMYYYGYGVQQDNDLGLYWIHKAADQEYPPAIKALTIIQENNSTQTTVDYKH